MIVETTEQLAEMVRLLSREDQVAFDTEGTSERPEDAALVGMSFATDNRAWYIPVGHEEGPQLNLDLVLDMVNPILKRGVIMHGGKYDVRLMAKYNVNVTTSLDTLSAVRLLGEVDYGVGLKETVERWFGYKMTSFKEVLKAAKAKNASQVPIEDLAPYACDDALFTWKIALEVEKRLSAFVKAGLLNYELDAMRVAAQMETVGLPIDRELLVKAHAEGLATVEQLRLDAIVALKSINPEVPDDLNLRSAPQLQHVLFDLCGMEVVAKSKKTKKPSANKVALAKLAKKHPEVEAIVKYRSAATTVSRIEELLEAARERDGWYYVHSSLNPAGAATGRWTSSAPNVQNHPRTPYIYETTEGAWEMNIRNSILAPPGFLIVSSDYSQVELRVAAGFSQEPAWMDAFANGVDVHTATAAAIFNVAVEDVTDKQRYMGKTLNFSMLFGASEYKVAELLGIDKAEAMVIIASWWRGLPKVTEWVKGVHKTATETGYVTTAFGRKRYLEGIRSSNDWERAAALRESANTIIQGTAADMLKVGLSRQVPIAHEFGAKIFLVVHDQFVWLVPERTNLKEFALSMNPAICPQLAGFPEILTDWGVGTRLGALTYYDDAHDVPQTYSDAGITPARVL